MPLPFDVCRMRRPKRSDDHGEMQGPLHLALKLQPRIRLLVVQFGLGWWDPANYDLHVCGALF